MTTCLETLGVGKHRSVALLEVVFLHQISQVNAHT